MVLWTVIHRSWQIYFPKQMHGSNKHLKKMRLTKFWFIALLAFRARAPSAQHTWSKKASLPLNKLLVKVRRGASTASSTLTLTSRDNYASLKDRYQVTKAYKSMKQKRRRSMEEWGLVKEIGSKDNCKTYSIPLTLKATVKKRSLENHRSKASRHQC